MTDVTSWLERYGAAWSAHDGAAAGALFAERAVYFFGPFDPVEGRAAIAERWDQATALQGEVSFDWDLLGTQDDRHIVNWRAVLQSGTPSATELDGVFVLDFAADGRCTELREWWASRPLGA
ncbi:MAG TPA: nuclear transport factor 2 family protein [Baekduia sp.]|nr:nuclear transport factor 2 family protein [Baekduia sp.]